MRVISHGQPSNVDRASLLQLGHLLSQLGDVLPHLPAQQPSLDQDVSAGQLSAQTESSSQHPRTYKHDKQDVERPNRQQRLRKLSTS